MQYVLGIIGAIALIGGGYYVFTSPSDTLKREAVRADGEFTIVASFYPLAFALESIAGAQAEVINISEGRDPHDYRPSTRDLERMQRADLVVLQGAGLEPWGLEVRETLEAAGVPVLIATEPLELHAGEHTHAHAKEDAAAKTTEPVAEHEHDHDENAHEDEHEDEPAHEHEEAHETIAGAETHDGEHEPAEEHEAEHEQEHDAESTDAHEDEPAHDDEHAHDHDGLDPHTWLDPVRFGETVTYLADELAALDPEQAATYAENAAGLTTELAELNTTYAATLRDCTAESAIVSHDAFGYLADRYGLTMHPIAGLSTADTPSAAQLAALREEARESGSRAVLTEQSSVTEFADTIAREAQLEVLPLNPIAFAIPEGEDYLTLMRGNLASLSTAYACAQ